MKKLRLGVVGAGHMGKLHAQKYAAMDDVDLVGITDIDFKKAISLALNYNSKAYTTINELLPYVDGVSLAVPTVSHFEAAYEVLNQGKHLLVEKPITLTLRDADILIEKAKNNNVILQVGHIERFNPAVIKMGPLISNPINILSFVTLPISLRAGSGLSINSNVIIQVDISNSLSSNGRSSALPSLRDALFPSLDLAISSIYGDASIPVISSPNLWKSKR